MEPKENIQFENKTELEVLESLENIDLLLGEDSNIQITLKYDAENPLDSSIDKNEVEEVQRILLESGLIPNDNHFRSFEINVRKMEYLSSVNHNMLYVGFSKGILDFNKEKYPDLSKEDINTSNASFSYYIQKLSGLYNSKNMSYDSINFAIAFNSYEELLADKLNGKKDYSTEFREISQNSYKCSENVLRKGSRKLLEEVDIKLLGWYFNVLEKQLELVV